MCCGLLEFGFVFEGVLVWFVFAMSAAETTPSRDWGFGFWVLGFWGLEVGGFLVCSLWFDRRLPIHTMDDVIL